MNVLENLKLIGVSILLIIGLAACDEPGTAESAGKKLDQAVDNAGNKIEDTVDKVGTQIDDTVDKVDSKIDDTVDKLDEQSDKAGVGIDDAGITTKVKAAIFAEPGLKSLQISVDTIKGVVTLSGSVDTQKNSDTARALASAVSGVHEVDNRLLIKPN